MQSISSRTHPFFKQLIKLGKNPQQRKKSGLTILDGVHLVESYYDLLGPPISLITSTSGYERIEIKKIARRFASNCCILNDSLFREVSPVKTPIGIMAIIAIPPVKINTTNTNEPCSILLESIQDPGNLGTILRSAAAAGFYNIYLSEDCADVWSPKVLRAAMGAHFLLQINERSDLAKTASLFNGKVIATSTQAKKSLYDISLIEPVAFIFGNEGKGLSGEMLKLSNEQITIPMLGKTESLNAASAAAICLFERVRQVTKKTNRKNLINNNDKF